jgi:preprotein translocase subunit SecY
VRVCTGYPSSDQTARYIDKIPDAWTLAGAVYITPVCLVPEFTPPSGRFPFTSVARRS